MTNDEIKTYQEIPVDLFDWAIVEYEGVKNRNYGVDLYGLIKFKNEPILIGRKDLGGCHPSWPYTSFQVYDYNSSIFDVIKEGFNSLNDSELEKKIIMKISSSEVSENKRITPIYNLVYKFPNKNTKKISKNLEILCKGVQKKTEEMLNSGTYKVSSGDSAEEYKNIFEPRDFKDYVRQKNYIYQKYRFMKFVENERKKYLTEKQWCEKFKTK